MGIKQLSSLLKKVTPASLDEWHSVDDYRGKTLAIDASPCLYQCLTTSPNVGEENDTSHVSGLLRRTVRLLELGIKPVFVFDGEAPNLKQRTLSKRTELRAKSQEQLEQARLAGDTQAVRKLAARLVKTTQRHNDDIIELLQLMGLPAVQAPSEAECLCSKLASSGRVDAVATEDYDALVFGAPKFLRFLHQGANRAGAPAIQEISLDKVLTGLGVTQPEFVDLCILAGCDYLDTISGIAVHTAYQQIKKHHSIEEVVKNLDAKKNKVPEQFDYQTVRAWFIDPNVGDVHAIPLEHKPVQDEKLRALLLEKHKLDTYTVDEQLRRLDVALGRDKTKQAQAPAAASEQKVVSQSDGDRCSQGPQVLQQIFAGPAALQSAPTPSRSASSMPPRSSSVFAGTSCAKGSSRGSAPLTTAKFGGHAVTPQSQNVLQKLFAKRKAEIEEEDESAKRRRLAKETLFKQFGPGVEVPATASLEELESFVAATTGSSDESSSPEKEARNVSETGNSSAGQGVVQIQRA